MDNHNNQLFYLTSTLAISVNHNFRKHDGKVFNEEYLLPIYLIAFVNVFTLSN